MLARIFSPRYSPARHAVTVRRVRLAGTIPLRLDQHRRVPSPERRLARSVMPTSSRRQQARACAADASADGQPAEERTRGDERNHVADAKRDAPRRTRRRAAPPPRRARRESSSAASARRVSARRRGAPPAASADDLDDVAAQPVRAPPDGDDASTRAAVVGRVGHVEPAGHEPRADGDPAVDQEDDAPPPRARAPAATRGATSTAAPTPRRARRVDARPRSADGDRPATLRSASTSAANERPSRAARGTCSAFGDDPLVQPQHRRGTSPPAAAARSSASRADTAGSD